MSGTRRAIWLLVPAFSALGCRCAPPECGNGVAEGSEACDGADLGGETCAAFGFLAGQPVCAADCTLAAGSCASCGDLQATGNEACDGPDLRGMDCSRFGFPLGVVACTEACTVDSAGCHFCGNGVVDAGEDCDGAPATDCVALGFPGGTVACDGSCRHDPSTCAPVNPSALRFDGVDDFVDLPAPPLSSYTVELWVNPDPQGGGWVLIRAGLLTSEQLVWIRAIEPSTGGLTWAVGTVAALGPGQDHCASASEWHHIAVAYDLSPEDGSARVDVYVNGGYCFSGGAPNPIPCATDVDCAPLAATPELCGGWDVAESYRCEAGTCRSPECGRGESTPMGWDGSTAVQPFRVGLDDDSSSPVHYNGLVDEVRIWDRYRTLADVRSTMYTRLSGTEPGLVSYWRFDEGGGEFLFDSSPTGAMTSLGSSPSAAADDPVWVTDTPF